MLRAIIIDDEENGLVSLQLLIEKFVSEIKIIACSTNALKGVECINDFRPDVVFLDINMPNLNGFELLEKIEFKNFHLIFTTAHEEYALKALKKQALDYLLKPIGADDLIKAVEKVKSRIKEEEQVPDFFTLLKELNLEQELKIAIPTKATIELVSPEDIMYVEADSNNSIVVFARGELINSSKSLKDFESSLCKGDYKFIRIHNSFIINVSCVSKYVKEDGGYAVMQNKKSIPVSKQKKEEFLKQINLKTD